MRGGGDLGWREKVDVYAPRVCHAVDNIASYSAVGSSLSGEKSSRKKDVREMHLAILVDVILLRTALQPAPVSRIIYSPIPNPTILRTSPMTHHLNHTRHSHPSSAPCD